jgi:1-acyl-sn-glycerol-3-phosphate acyltransferase
MQLGMVITRVRLFRTGFEPEMGRSYMIISNHQSIIDIVVLVWLFRGNHIKFVMKKELQWGIPNVSPATRAARFAFLDREAGGHAAEQPLAEMARVVREEGTGVVIFPEGTRGRDGKVRRFKVGGTGILARHLDLPVVVVTLDGTWRAAQPRQMLRNLPGLEIRVHVEEPGSIEPFRRNAEEALAEVRSLMERRLAEMRAGSSRIPPQEAASG